ncbi:MAG: hypothetical protein JSS01_02250 [Proteobacteria bacterium]|nr:hypothetical protein [Pseudomonadota bacterium]
MKIWNPLGYFAAAGYRGRWLAGLGLAAAVVSGSAHAQAYVNATVGGQLAPGVYGRVDIGNGPAPTLLFAQPVVVAPPPIYAPRAPIYMYVPPGHAKHWARYCARYAACNQPVYFLSAPPRRPDHFHGHRDHHEWRRGEGRRGHERGHGRGDEHRGGDHGHRHGRHEH